MFDPLFISAMNLLTMQGWPYHQAVPQALQMANDALMYLRHMGVVVDSPLAATEAGISERPSAPHPPAPTNTVAVASPTPPPAAPVQASAPGASASPELIEFIQNNLKTRAWMAEDNFTAAQAFADELHQRFGLVLRDE